MGDRLLSVDGRDVSSFTRGQLLDSLHGGAPDQKRHLVLERDGMPFEVDASVMGF